MKAYRVSFAVSILALHSSAGALHQEFPAIIPSFPTTTNPETVYWDGQIKNIIPALIIRPQQTTETDPFFKIEPNRRYSFNELKSAIAQSPESNEDAQAVFKFLHHNILSKLDQIGVRISYQNSFFEPDVQEECSPAGTYLPASKYINIYCRRPISILLAESAHAIDALLGSDGFRTQEDPLFKKIFINYRNNIDRHILNSGHSSLKEHLEKSHPGRWNYQPGLNDSDPILGPQGYDSILELYMEGMIHFFYHPQKLKRFYPDLAQYIEESLEEAAYKKAKKDLKTAQKPFILVDPI